MINKEAFAEFRGVPSLLQVFLIDPFHLDSYDPYISQVSGA